MIHFHTTPDPMFTALAKEALGLMRDLIHDSPDDWHELFPLTAPWATRTLAQREAGRLRRALARAEVVDIADAHWLLLYTALAFKVDLHNDDVETQRGGVELIWPPTIGDDEPGLVSLAAVLDLFFPDTLDILPLDDLIDCADDDSFAREALALTAVQQWVARGGRPGSPGDVALTPVRSPSWLVVPPEQLFRPGVSTRYPDCSPEFLAELHDRCHANADRRRRRP